MTASGHADHTGLWGGPRKPQEAEDLQAHPSRLCPPTGAGGPSIQLGEAALGLVPRALMPHLPRAGSRPGGRAASVRLGPRGWARVSGSAVPVGGGAGAQRPGVCPSPHTPNVAAVHEKFPARCPSRRLLDFVSIVTDLELKCPGNPLVIGSSPDFVNTM